MLWQGYSIHHDDIFNSICSELVLLLHSQSSPASLPTSTAPYSLIPVKAKHKQA